MVNYGPCEPWPGHWVCDLSCESPEVTGLAVNAATEVLWALSGRQFGYCDVTLRPCRRDCYDDFPTGYTSPWSGGFVTPALIGGQWFNLICGGCGDNCSCTSLSEVRLPAPVSEILEVKINGVILDPSRYSLHDSNIVVLNNDTWPHCNDLNEPDTEPGTYSITARYGQDVPALAQLAMGELVCDLIRGMKGEDCKLPRNVSNLARQGVTINFPDVIELLKERRTGLYNVDLFITTFNPHGLSRRSKTYNVDEPEARRIR